MIKLCLILPLLVIGLSACSMLQRTDASGYANMDDNPNTIEEFYSAKKMKNWNEAREEIGLKSSSTLTEQEAASVRQRVALKKLEKEIPSEAEKKQYYALKPYFSSDADRVYFLRLPDRDIRARWAAAKGISTEEKSFPPEVSQLIENNDIGQGMSKNAVKQSWGEPDYVDVAGNPLYGNERWKFNKLVSTDEGYKSETRIIYFESGRVVGWETQQ